MHKYLLICIGTFVASGIKAQTTAPSLQELIESAIINDHKLANQQLDIASAKIDRQKLSEVYLPTADISGKYAYLNSSVNVSLPATTLPILDLPISELNSGFNTTGNLFKTDLNVSSVLFSGGKVPALKKALEHKTKAQEIMLEKSRQDIITQVSKTYDQLALLKQVKVVLDESSKRLNINSKTADKALNYGLITKYDHQKIEVAQAQLESKIQDYEGKKMLLQHQLHQLTGIPLERIMMIDSELSPLSSVNNENDIAHRPELQALEAGIEAYKAKTKAAQTWWVPKVKAAASLGYLNFFDASIKGKETLPLVGRPELRTNKIEVAPNIILGVGFKWDIFDGLKGKREVQQSKIEVQKAINEKDEAEELLALNLIKTQSDFKNSNAEIIVKQKQMKVAQNALNMAGKEFKVGLVKASDLIGAETDYQTAALDYYQAIFNQRRNAIELLKSTGDLNLQSIQ